jgi:hypothetical protein
MSILKGKTIAVVVARKRDLTVADIEFLEDTSCTGVTAHLTLESACFCFKHLTDLTHVPTDATKRIHHCITWRPQLGFGCAASGKHWLRQPAQVPQNERAAEADPVP